MSIAALLAAVTSAIPVVTNLLTFIGKARATLMQSKELTAAQERKLDEAIAKLKTAPQPWQAEQPL